MKKIKLRLYGGAHMEALSHCGCAREMGDLGGYRGKAHAASTLPQPFPQPNNAQTHSGRNEECHSLVAGNPYTAKHLDGLLLALAMQRMTARVRRR